MTKRGTSLADMRPDLGAQWNFELNGTFTPENTSAMSKRKVGWICGKGHTWINDPQHRMRSAHADCPYCTGKRVISGENDLATLFPALLTEWNYSLNGDLDPHALHRSSNKKVWWVCVNGHEWKASISHRTHPDNPTGCPYCAGQRVVPGENDLASQRPDIAAQWDSAANAPLLPTQVTVSSRRDVWWLCGDGHSWRTSVAHRTAQNQSTSCPYCAGRRAIQGKTDLATLYPSLMREWDWDLNKALDPAHLRPHSTKKAHWKCVRNHRWEAVIRARTRAKGTTCPYCSGRRAIPGETDLQTLFPEIASSWNHEKNGGLSPSTTSAASNKKVAWICKSGHQWEATVASRTYQGNNCPVCSGRKPDVGCNDLCTLRPDLVLDWDPENNGDRQPQEYTCNSSYIAAWRCHRCGIRWQKAIISRNKGNKCPSCHGNINKED